MTDRDSSRSASESLAASLAPLLPDWRIDLATDPAGERYDWVDLVRDDGARIRLTVGGFRAEGRVTLRGCWPRYRDGRVYSGGKSASITCDASRSPYAIAREIERRLLPVYLPRYAEALLYVLSHEESADEAQAIAERIASAIGGDVGGKAWRSGDDVFIQHVPDSIYRLRVCPAYESATYGHPARVSFEAHDLDPETAAQVLQIIREAETRRREEAGAVRVKLETLARVENDVDEAEEEDESSRKVARVMP